LFSGPVWGSPAPTEGDRQPANLPSPRFLSTPLTSTLSSPSSFESIAHSPPRVLSSVFDPTSPLSSATSPAQSVSHHGHSQSTSTSSVFASPPQPSMRTVAPGSSLYHSTSMYDYGGLRSGPSDVPDVPARRPSMPIISTRQTAPGSTSSGSQQLRSIPDNEFTALFPTVNLPFSGTLLSANTGPLPVTPSISGKTITSASAGAGVAGGSLGRSGSVFGKSTNLLRKKDTAGVKERDKEKRLKGKEKEDETKWLSKDSKRQSQQRPKLSLSTSSGSHQSLTDASGLQQPRSPTLSNATKSMILRHVKSGPSLISGGEEDNNVMPPSPSNGLSESPKKRSELTHSVSKRRDKLMKGSRSALDFVDPKR